MLPQKGLAKIVLRFGEVQRWRTTNRHADGRTMRGHVYIKGVEASVCAIHKHTFALCQVFVCAVLKDSSVPPLNRSSIRL